MNQPWHFEGSLFAIRSITGGEQQSSMSITESLFWVRAYDFPIDFQTDEDLIVVASKVGTLESFVSLTDYNYGEFVHFKVAINITKPLMRGTYVRSDDNQM